ncbi:alpha-galactosidase [Roseburia hominis]
MSIIFDNEKRTFTLHTKDTTYQMQVDAYGFLLHLYYGNRAQGCMDYLLTYHDRGFSGNPYDVGRDRTYSMDALPQEFPCYGNGDYRSSALVVQNENGTYSCDLRYKTYEIKNGKYSLPGLPAVYASEEEAQTLEVVLEDPAIGMEAVLYYGVLEQENIITRSVKLVNTGSQKVYLEKVQSACLDFLSGKFDVINFYGRHAMERNFQRTPVSHSNMVIGSRRGTSSHQYSPVLILAEHRATEKQGSCYAMNFVYSGGFKGEVEMDQFHQTRAMIGIQDETFCYPLEPQEVFYAPEAILTYTNRGLNHLSQNMHTCIRKHICRGRYRDEVRPVLVNSWEASYFQFDGESLCRLAAHASEVGIEMLVMDDGWFGRRDDDNSGLGDWYVNEKKLGMSLSELSRRIHSLGLGFGIWVEPEMVNEDSDLYREHPDWAFTIPGRKPVRARNQLVLDFSRKEVVDHIYDQICKVLDQGEIEYLKWDMNRSISDVYSAVTRDQGKVLYDYVLGLYDFLERLHNQYPDMLIEGCSGGGGRFDAGMMYYTPQIWCSDNTDAIDRVRIQYGSSFGFPIAAVGSHVSAVPNHQTGRTTPIGTRGIVAMAGTFGYELDLGKLTFEEKEEIRRQVQAYHRFAPLIMNGDYYRLTNPFEEEVGAWAFVSKAKDQVLLNVVMLEVHGNMTTNYVRLQGLEPETMYREEGSGKVYSGAALMEVGLPILMEFGEYQSRQLYFQEQRAE